MTPAAPAPDSAPPVSELAATWQHVLLMHARVENRLAAALQRTHGIGLSEFRALGHLAASPTSELRMQELADKVGLNQSSVTRLVARLSTADFAVRDLCPDDKRGVYTVITETGRTRHTEASRTYEETLKAALEEARQADPRLAAALTALGAPRADHG
ncbi:MarR family transcriptional regulator [Spongiactinospora sp. TRM90649]|uniref:MarR family winged helix-turn-helix transcriptional regulator n=1 Tax=Spongiactinospora sp. TRM90649 TaxID=3031114 RepID=UPI0023F9D7AC|nr:MarR family transcriptional regulator [Spongiactinospora sp. TRM90649]MDF5755111.1 MarR family transcriptional regulator [Spongiactinospora sp. TRM90649]